MPLNKRSLNKLLERSNFRIDKIIETIDDSKGTNYLCEKQTKVRVKVKEFEEPIEHFNYNAIDDDQEITDYKQIEDEIELHSDVYLEIPQEYFDDKTEFFGLHKIQVKPVTKKYRKGTKPSFNLWAKSFPHFSFETDALEIPGTREIITGKNNPYNYYTKFKSTGPFIPSIRFCIFNPFLVSNTNQRIDVGDEYDIIFFDYVVILTNNLKKNTPNFYHILLSRSLEPEPDNVSAYKEGLKLLQKKMIDDARKKMAVFEN
jgi:hypothetical protein